MSDRAYDRSRLKSLVHYVIWAADAHPKFGATKLNKIAWFSDARRFVLSGQSITGSPYIREKHGPVPRDIMIVRGIPLRLCVLQFDLLPDAYQGSQHLDHIGGFRHGGGHLALGE